MIYSTGATHVLQFFVLQREEQNVYLDCRASILQMHHKEYIYHHNDFTF